MNEFGLGLELIKYINTLGYEAYLVGGCVRDYLLNIPSNDIDITTSMPIDEIKTHFTTIDNGSSYYSLTILYHNISFEITHFRKDLRYLDNRHPEVIYADTLIEDAERRDFTINALALNHDKKIYDYFEGLSDLKNKIIRTINDPNERFQEDSLRILRGLYFSSKLNFDIENNTLNAMIENRHLLKNLSNERIYDYFIKLVYANTNKGIKYIINNNIFEYIEEYKAWLLVSSNRYSIDSLKYLYTLNYLKYPPMINKKEKRLCDILIQLIENNYSNYYLYLYQNELINFKEILDDYYDLKNRIISFPIKNDNDLAISKEEISSHFLGANKSLMIKKIITKILNNELDNTQEAINRYIREISYE